MAVIEAIQTQVVQTDVTSVSFTLPTSGYQHVYVSWAQRGTLQSTGMTPYLTMNSNSSNYYRYGWSNYTGSNYDQKANAETSMELGSLVGTSIEGTVMEYGQVWFYNYRKSGSGQYNVGMYWYHMGEWQRSTVTSQQMTSGLRGFLDGSNQNALSTIQFFHCCSSNITMGSSFTLYGVKSS